MSVINKKKEIKRFIKFGIVGFTGSVIDFGVFNLLTIAFDVASIASSTVSFALAVINNFVLNRFWTYPETRQTPIYKPLVKFIIVSCLGLAIRIPLFAWLEKVLIPLAEKTIPNVLTPTIVGHNLSLAIVIGVVMLWNFFVNRFWTFKSVPA
ncbi:MAG: GtrA family protein [Anaerolineaceae bacterium]|jgi:putative flippase GtrA|nr:GtrA family protein [Anaerolineaceae bacterium]